MTTSRVPGRHPAEPKAGLHPSRHLGRHGIDHNRRCGCGPAYVMSPADCRSERRDTWQSQPSRGCRHGVAGAIAGLTQRTRVRFARAHNEIEPRSRDTPVGFLIRSHVVVVVPRQILSCPIGIEVSAFVYAMVADRAVPDGGGEERRNGQEWQMSGGKHGETQRLFALGMPAPNGALVVRIPKTMTT